MLDERSCYSKAFLPKRRKGDAAPSFYHYRTAMSDTLNMVSIQRHDPADAVLIGMRRELHAPLTASRPAVLYR